MALSGNDGIQWARGNNDVLYPKFIGNNYNAVTITSAQGTTPQLIITGNPGYVVVSYGLQFDATSTITTAGMVSAMFTDSSSGIIANFRWYLPGNITPATLPSNDRVVNAPDSIWNNKVANSTLSVSLDTALLTGSARFFVRYALTKIVG